MSSKKEREITKQDRLKDDEWIRTHFEYLVERYGGMYIVVAGEEVFSGKDPATLQKEARRKHPGVTPIGMPVPRPQDFICAL